MTIEQFHDRFIAECDFSLNHKYKTTHFIRGPSDFQARKQNKLEYNIEWSYHGNRPVSLYLWYIT